MTLSKKILPTTLSSASKSGYWLKRLSLFAVLILPLTVLGYRFGLYPFSVALKLLAVSLLIAVVTFLASLFISVKQRHSNPSNSRQAQFSVAISLIPLLVLGSQALSAKSAPMIHNISTDIIDPPKFNEIVALRGSSSNPHAYNLNELGEIQKTAYPNIKTLTATNSVGEAFSKSLLVIEELGWDLVSSNQQTGIIEASQTTKLWAFTDDVVIRIVQNNEKTDIDLHSVSRVGLSDLGANAKRIQTFFNAYTE